MPTTTKKSSGRIHELDLLRGFFVLAIILDHAQRIPDIHMYFTGQGKLWMSAAEGFFLISGMLTGYVRGWKQRELPFKQLSAKLIKRGLMLYAWAVGLTFFLVSLSVLLPIDLAHVAKLPEADQTSSLLTYVINVISTKFSYDWIYFLRLYAIILIISPLFIYMARKGKIWLAMIISVLIYALSFLQVEPEGSAQWQLVFFTAAAVGYKLPVILEWFKTHQSLRKFLHYSSIVSAILIFIISYFFVLGWPSGFIMSREQYEAIRLHLDPLFANNPLMPLRILVSMIWFSGILSLFHVLRPWLEKWGNWLLDLFGTRSLSAYCLQAFVLIIFNWIVPFHDNFLYNLPINILLVLSVWGLLKIPLVQRILPA